MLNESLCQQCGATFSAPDRTQLIKQEGNHSLDSKVPKEVQPGDMQRTIYPCNVFDLILKNAGVEEKVGYRIFTERDLDLEEIWQPATAES